MFIEMGQKAEIILNQSNYYSTQKKIKYYYDKTIYQKYFEQHLLLETRNYYRKESQKHLQFKNTRDYMISAQKRFEEECLRCENYLDPSSKEQLIEEFMTNYVGRVAKELLVFKKQGIHDVINNNQVEDLKIYIFIFKQSKSTFKILENELQSYLQD